MGGTWNSLDLDEADQLDKMRARGARRGVIRAKAEEYAVDFTVMTLTNKATGKMQMIAFEDDLSKVNRSDGVVSSDAPEPRPGLSAAPFFAGRITRQSVIGVSRLIAQKKRNDKHEVCQVWVAGKWQPLPKDESLEILANRSAGTRFFRSQSRGQTYTVDLDRMTQVSHTGHQRVIRIHTRAFRERYL